MKITKYKKISKYWSIHCTQIKKLNILRVFGIYKKSVRGRRIKMSNIKLIKNLKISETEKICNDVDGCAKCPLLISSFAKKIHCLRDDKVEMYEVEKTYSLLNSKIDLETNKLMED